MIKFWLFRVIGLIIGIGCLIIWLDIFKGILATGDAEITTSVAMVAFMVASAFGFGAFFASILVEVKGYHKRGDDEQ